MAARDNPFYIQPPNVYEALLAGQQGYDRASDQMRQNENDAILKQVGAEVAQGGISDSALGRLFGMSRGAGVPALNAAAALQRAKMEGQHVYGNPIWGTDSETGKEGVGVFDKMGRFRVLQTGGFQPNSGLMNVSTPQADYLINKRTGQPAGGAPQAGQGVPGQTQNVFPKDYKNTEADKVVGRETGEKAAAMGKAKATLDNSVTQLDNLQLQANEVLHHPGLGRITGMVGMLPNVPGFPGADAQAKLETLRAKVGFSALQTMRDMSKTGGALGQVSDFENRLLQNSMVELQNAQTEKQIKMALTKLIGQVDGIKDRLRQAYETDYAGLQRPASNMQPGAGQPPIQGARQAPDGNWYIQNQQTGKYYRVQQ
jgi:hypothetical protein